MLMAQLRSSSAERLKREMLSLLQHISSEAPLVLFLEDLHWSDESTNDLLAFVAARLQSSRVMIVTTFRPSEMHRLNHAFVPVKLELQSRGLARELQLDKLSASDVRRYVDAEFPAHRFPDDFLALVHARTEGYPLFFVDLFRYLRDRSVIAQGKDGWELREPVARVATDLPESVHSMVQRKVQQLDSPSEVLLAAASVQGSTFHAVVAARILHLDEAEVEERLRSIARRHALIEILDDERLPNGQVTMSCRFAHGLYQNAAYATLTPSRRARLSATVADVLVEYHGTATHPATLAMLYETGNDYLRAAAQFAAAARAATQIFGYSEALSLARRGLTLLELVTDSRERAHEELQLHIALIRPMKALFGYASQEVMETYERVRTLSELLDAQRESFFVLSGFCTLQWNREELSSALTLAEQCSTIAEKTGDPVLLAQAAWLRGALLHNLGRPTEARTVLEAGHRVYEPATHHGALTVFGLGDGPAVSIAVLGNVLWSLGHHRQAYDTLTRALHIAARLEDPPTTALMLCVACSLAISGHQTEAAHVFVQQLGSMKIRNAFINPMIAMFRASILPADELGCDPVQAFAAAYESYTRISSISLTSYKRFYARLLIHAERFSDALRAIDDGLSIAKNTGERAVEPELWRLRGDALIGSGASNDAEEAFNRAIAVARQQSARSWELRARLSLARVLESSGRRDEARDQLEHVVSCDDMSESVDYRDARALLDQLR